MEFCFQEFFLESLPVALSTYVNGDDKTCRAILEGLQFEDTDTILNDAKINAKPIIRDYSGLKRLCDELEITDKTEFDFRQYQ